MGFLKALARRIWLFPVLYIMISLLAAWQMPAAPKPGEAESLLTWFGDVLLFAPTLTGALSLLVFAGIVFNRHRGVLQKMEAKKREYGIK